MLSTCALVAALAPCSAQDNHRETHKTLFRSGTLRNKERLRTSTATPLLVTPQPSVTEAPTSTTTSTTSTTPDPSVVLSAETNNTEVTIAREVLTEVNATTAPKAEKLFGQPDLRTHLFAQQQRQQQLAFEVLKAATQTPNGFASTQIQQASVPDLQQLLAYMQQGNQYNVYQPQQYGFGTTGGAGLQSFFQQSNQYQPSPAYFSPNLSPYGQQQQQQAFGGLNGLPLPYNPPITPNYVFHNNGYHIQGSPSLPANLQGSNVPTIKFSVATPISVQGQPQDISRPPSSVFVRPTQPTSQPPSPPQFINTVFQPPNDQSQIPPSYRPSPEQSQVYEPSQGRPPFDFSQERPPFQSSQGRPPFGLSQGPPPFGLSQGQSQFGSQGQSQFGSQGQSQFGPPQGQPQYPQQNQGQSPFLQQQDQPTYTQQQDQSSFAQQQGQSPSSFGGQNQGNFVTYFPQRANNQQPQQPFSSQRGEFTQQTQQQAVPSPPAQNHPFSRTPVFFPPQALKGLKKTAKAAEALVEENEVKETKEAKIEASRIIPIYTTLFRSYPHKF
jgi:hypothetical protein